MTSQMPPTQQLGPIPTDDGGVWYPVCNAARGKLLLMILFCGGFSAILVWVAPSRPWILGLTSVHVGAITLAVSPVLLMAHIWDYSRQRLGLVVDADGISIDQGWRRPRHCRWDEVESIRIKRRSHAPFIFVTFVSRSEPYRVQEIWIAPKVFGADIDEILTLLNDRWKSSNQPD